MWYGIGAVSQPGLAGMLQGTNVGAHSCELVFGRLARSAVLSDYDGPVTKPAENSRPCND